MSPTQGKPPEDEPWWAYPLTLFILGGLMLLWAWWHPGGII